ncbi:FeoA family protein [Lusitaniella coriacea]|nr:FeoA family protein [Lusitaniella coriacea]
MEPETAMEAETIGHLKSMAVGTVGRVVGYDKALSGYRGRLLSMGLLPGTEFMLLRVASLDDTIDILVSDRYLRLRKPEADALVVEEAIDGE